MEQYDDKLKRSAGQHSVYGEECERCPQLTRSRKQVTFGYGAVPSVVMFVGEAPGQQGCNITGIPFTRDRSGVFFQLALRETGFDFAKVYTTNICKCSPFNNRGPDETEIKRCLPFLQQEIKDVKPKLVVCLGRVASVVFLNTTSFSVVSEAGSLYRSGVSWFNGDVVILPHPAFALRNGKKGKKEFVEAMKHVFRLYEKAKVVDTKITDARWE